MNLQELKQEIPYKWKIQSFNNKDKKLATKASCVAYIDARDAMDLLDKVCGADNWQDKYEFIGNKLIAGIGVKCGSEWVWKFDTGTESDYEAEKGQFSDAFKRAGVKWGVGRFLYDKTIVWVDVVDGKPQLAQFKTLSEYCEAIDNKVPIQTSPNAPQSTIPHKIIDSGLKVFCETCGSVMTERNGVKDGKEWTGYFCPKSTKDAPHPPRWI